MSGYCPGSGFIVDDNRFDGDLFLIRDREENVAFLEIARVDAAIDGGLVLGAAFEDVRDCQSEGLVYGSRIFGGDVYTLSVP